MSRNAHSRRLPAVIALAVVALLAAGCRSLATPQGWAAPTVSSDLLYTSHAAGKLGAYRLDGSGARVWEVPQKDLKVDLSAIYGNVVLRDDTVYIGGYAGNLAAVNAADGSLRWAHRAGPRVIGGLLVTADTVYAGTDEGNLVAVNRVDGSERWRHSVGN